MSPAPSPLHQRAIAGLYRVLHKVAPTHLDVLFAPLDVALAPDTVIQPDLIVAPRDSFTERDLPVAPLLAIEVLSPSTRGIDLLLKKDRLERARCPHYWVVDPDEPSIIAWRLVGDAYRLVAQATGDRPFETATPSKPRRRSRSPSRRPTSLPESAGLGRISWPSTANEQDTDPHHPCPPQQDAERERAAHGIGRRRRSPQTAGQHEETARPAPSATIAQSRSTPHPAG